MGNAIDTLSQAGDDGETVLDERLHKLARSPNPVLTRFPSSDDGDASGIHQIPPAR